MFVRTPGLVSTINRKMKILMSPKNCKSNSSFMSLWAKLWPWLIIFPSPGSEPCHPSSIFAVSFLGGQNQLLCWVLLCFIDPRVRKRNEASSCPRIFSRTLRVGCAASGGAVALEPTRATGVGPESDLYILFFLQCLTLSVLVSTFVTFSTFFLKSDKVSTFLPEIGHGSFLHFPGLCTLSDSFFLRSDVSHPEIWDRTTKSDVSSTRNLRSDKVRFPKSEIDKELCVWLKNLNGGEGPRPLLGSVHFCPKLFAVGHLMSAPF